MVNIKKLSALSKKLKEEKQKREDAFWQHIEELENLAKKHKKKYSHQKGRNTLLKEETYETIDGFRHSVIYGDELGYTGQIVDNTLKTITMVRLNKPNGDDASVLTITPYFLDYKDAIEFPDQQQRILRRIKKWIIKRGACLEEMYANYQATYHGIALPKKETPLTLEKTDNKSTTALATTTVVNSANPNATAILLKHLAEKNFRG